MTPEIEAFYPAIGNLLIEIPQVPFDAIALYAEAEEGVVSCNVFYLPEGGGVLMYRFGPLELDRLVYDLWEKWRETPGLEPWRAILYTLRGRKMSIDIVYGDRFDENADDVERRTAAVQAELGKLKIDYSEAQPGSG